MSGKKQKKKDFIPENTKCSFYRAKVVRNKTNKFKQAKIKSTSDKKYYIILWTKFETISTGIYKSKEDTYKYLSQYVIKKKNKEYILLKEDLKEKYKVSLNDKKFNYIISGVWEDYTSLEEYEQKQKLRDMRYYISRKLSYVVIEYEPSSYLFNFNQYEKWNNNNLYNLLNIYMNQTGSLI